MTKLNNSRIIGAMQKKLFMTKSRLPIQERLEQLVKLLFFNKTT